MMTDNKNNNSNSMDSRLLASLLSSLSSQLLLALLFFFPNNSPVATTITLPRPNLNLPLLLLLVNFLSSSSQIASSLSLLSTKKRKREDNELWAPPSPRPDANVDPFKVCFRMASSTFEWLTGLLEPLLECRDPLGSPLNLPPEIRLGIGLFRLASGSDYAHVARRFGVSESVSRFCTKQLCRVLCTNFRFWVAFPAPNEFQSVSTSFQRLARGSPPNCCGVIGCTRFKIRQQTVVAQIVVDSSSRILNIVAGLRGDKGASTILKCSTLYNDVQQGRLLTASSLNVQGVSVPQYLVGDQGYRILPWLMVPFSNPVTASFEDHYNAQIRKMRLPGLRTFASLKSWGILNKPIEEEEYKTAVACIGACSILHNALLSREDFSALSDEIEDYDHCSQYHPDNCMEEDTTTSEATLIRNALATEISKLLD